MKRICICLLGLLALAPATGCSTMQEAWNDTVHFYYEYIDVPPEIDLEAADYEAETEKRLARYMTPVDLRVEAMARLLATRETRPDIEWIEAFIGHHDWLGGIQILDAQGNVLAERSPAALKKVDASSLAQGVGDYDHELRGAVQSTDLGPELLLGMPYFENSTYQGMTVVHFDLASVLKFSERPDALFVAWPGGLLWAGGADPASHPLSRVNWVEALAEDVAGEVEAGDVDYAWVARPLGQTWITYAVRAE